MIDLTKCVIDISNWDSISIIDKKTGDNITNLSVGDVSMLSFVYLGDKIYFGEPGESHYGAIWYFFCKKNHIDPINQKKYDENEIDDICQELRRLTKAEGRFWGGVNIIQILDCKDGITYDRIINDVCNYVKIPKNKCYEIGDGDNWEELPIIEINENKNYNFTERQMKLFECKKILKEGSRDNQLLPYLQLIQKKDPQTTMSQLKNFLMKKFVTEANIHSLSLGSNFYLSGVAKYYFNGDLTNNKRLNVFYPNVTDKFIPEVCQRLDEIILYLRNSYIDTTGTKWEQPEDFGELTIAKLFRKYGGIIDKQKSKAEKYATPKEDDLTKYSDKIGKDYTYDIMYSQEDCKKYNQATSPGAWCITYGKQHYDGYTKRNKSHFVIFKKNGYESIPRKMTHGFPLDEYGVSLLAVQQSNVDGSFICCTTRWNHGGHGGASTIDNADNAVTYEQLKKITGINDSKFSEIFQQWEKQNKIVNNKSSEKFKEKTTITDIIRTFKYAQIMVQNGSNLKQLKENGLINDYFVISVSGNDISPDKIKISKSVLAVSAVKDGVTKWTIADRGVFLPDVVLGDSVSMAKSTYKFNNLSDKLINTIVCFNNRNKGYILYNTKIHNIISFNGNKYFEYGKSLQKNDKYCLFVDKHDQFSLLNAETLKPIITPNNESVFEKIVVKEFCDVIQFVYDSSAKQIYYFNMKTDNFINEIESYECVNTTYCEDVEKHNILTLQQFVPSLEWRHLYKTFLFDVSTNEFMKDKEGDVLSFNDFHYLAPNGYCMFKKDNSNVIYNILEKKFLTYPNNEIIECYTANYIDNYIDNMHKQIIQVRDKYNMISITLVYREKYCFYDLYTNKFFINEDGGIFFKEYGRGKVYNKYGAVVELPMTAGGPYWYQTSKKIDNENVNKLLEDGVHPNNIFDDIKSTYDYFLNKEGEVESKKYAIVRLNNVYNLLDCESNPPKVISNNWFKSISDISDNVCCVELLGDGNFYGNKNYLKLNGDLLFPNMVLHEVRPFNPETHLAIIKEGYRMTCNIIKKDGTLLLDKNADLPVAIWERKFNGVNIFEAKYHKLRNPRYISTNGNVFKYYTDAVKDSLETTSINENIQLNNIVSSLINECSNLIKKFDGKSNGVISRNLFENIKHNELSDVIKSFNPQSELNPKLWVNNKLNSRVRLRLLDIADKFVDTLDISWVKPEDIVITGSLCNYNWSKYSDIDLHILINFKNVHERTDFVKSYFDSKKKIWNDTHDNLKIYGFPVELYVQDCNEDHISSAIYSLEKNKWIVEPNKDKMESLKGDKKKIITKVSDIIEIIDSYEKELDNETDIQKIEILGKKVKKLFDKIKRARKHDLHKNGELGLMNIIFKSLRRCGYLKKLVDLKIETFDKIMSLN